MSRLDTAKKVVSEYADRAECGIFNMRNWVGDTMETIYKDDEIQIDICWFWGYFEVFGLSNEEFEELKTHYEAMGGMTARTIKSALAGGDE